MTLEAHYPLTEDVGNVALDYSGNGFNGTLNGGAGPSGTGTVTGPFGNSAYDFDGTDDEVVVSNNSNLQALNGDLSWFCWVNTTNQFFRPMNMTSSNGSVSKPTQQLTVSDPGILTIIQSSSETASVAAGPSVIDGNWHHIGYTWSATTHTITAYVDGEEVGNDTNTNMGTIDPGSDLHIGVRASGSGYETGQIADVRNYKRPLSPQEVQALYQAGERSEAVFAVTDSTATARSVSGGGGGGFYGGGSGGGSTGGGGGGTTY